MGRLDVREFEVTAAFYGSQQFDTQMNIVPKMVFVNGKLLRRKEWKCAEDDWRYVTVSNVSNDDIVIIIF